MSVASHLNIQLGEYDARIRTFVPHYTTMIGVISSQMDMLPPDPTIVELGIGTGALGAASLEVRPDARIVGIDADPAMLDAARARLDAHTRDAARARLDAHTRDAARTRRDAHTRDAHTRDAARATPRHELLQGDFSAVRLPACDAIIACLALHHVPTPESKQRLYAACHSALRPGGWLLSGDCFPAREPRLAERQHRAWLAHLQQTYTPAQASDYLITWAREDTYFPLDDELEWLRTAGFRTDLLWRRDGFAVIAAVR